MTEEAPVKDDKKNKIIELLKKKGLSKRDGAFGFSQLPYPIFLAEVTETLGVNREEAHTLFTELVNEKKIKAMFVRGHPTYIYGVT
ncbi:MAG: hypothetical protein ACE5KO_03260 [Candidatus Bathyarchaeia archaeon]